MRVQDVFNMRIEYNTQANRVMSLVPVLLWQVKRTPIFIEGYIRIAPMEYITIIYALKAGCPYKVSVLALRTVGL